MEKTQEFIKTLKNIPLFAEMSDSQLSKIALQIEELSIPSGTVVLCEGELADDMYIVKEGKLEVYTHGKSNEEIVLGTLKKGSHFGEQALLGKTVRNASVRTLTECILLKIKQKIFTFLLEKYRILKNELQSIGVEQLTSRLNELVGREDSHEKIRSLTEALIKANKGLIQNQKIIHEDLKAAALIQQSLLPSKSQEYSKVRFAFEYCPYLSVGGDLFDIIQVDDKMIIYILDVSGHNIPSAMVTISVAQFIQQQNLAHGKELIQPKEMINLLNKQYPFNKFDRFFTIMYLLLDLHTGKLLYSGAGHPPGIILKTSGNMEFLTSKNGIIGLNGNKDVTDQETVLTKGDKLILYTDGITDFQDASNEFFGTKRFIDLLEKNKTEPIEKLKNNVLHSLREYGKGTNQTDDFTLLGMEIL